MVNLVPLNSIAHLINNGDYIEWAVDQFFVTQNSDDKVIVLVDKNGGQVSTIAQYDPIKDIFSEPISTNISVRPLQSSRLRSYLKSLDKNVLIELLNKLGITKDGMCNIPSEKFSIEYSLQEINRYMKPDEKDCIVHNVREINTIQWHMGKSFRDLQTLNLSFIQGFSQLTPYHVGPLDDETSIILNDIYNMNILGAITFNSQPYEKFAINGTIIRSRSYVDFYYDSNKAHRLIDRLKNYSHLIVAFINKNNKFVYNKPFGYDEKYPLHQDFILNEWEDNYDTSFFYDLFYDSHIFGDNFKPLVENELTQIRVVNTRFDDSLLPLIISSIISQ